jgi:hypothetical protein
LSALNDHWCRAAGRLVVLDSIMGDRTFSRLVDQVTGDGCLLNASAEVGQVSYAIEMREVWAWHNGARLSGSEVTVRLSNHSIDPHCWKDQPLTLVLWDELRISGYISEDGTEFVRTGAPDSPRSAAPEHDLVRCLTMVSTTNT